MNRLITRGIAIGVFVLVVFGLTGYVSAGCPECEEVAKGKIPAKFLEKSVKELPSGIAIWDVEEVLPALKDKEAKLLWVDTRPGSFLKIGTVKPAVNLVCDLKGLPVADADKDKAISADKLKTEMKKIDPDIKNVKVVFFCQGPKCHRSYNAALRSVREYGLDASQVIWFRDGYPNLEKSIVSEPKLKKRISRYLRGDVVNS